MGALAGASPSVLPLALPFPRQGYHGSFADRFAAGSIVAKVPKDDLVSGTQSLRAAAHRGTGQGKQVANAHQRREWGGRRGGRSDRRTGHSAEGGPQADLR